MTQNGRTRRAVLEAVVGAAALAGAAGCGLLGGGSRSGAASQPSPLLPVLTGTLALIDTYTATLAAQPALAGTLEPLLADHRAHVTALSAAMGGTASAARSGSAAGSPSPGSSVPDQRAEALAAVRAAERAARDAAVRACLAAQPRYASLLGSIAACRSCHLEVLV